MEIIIDNEFRDLLIPLTTVEREGLEESILSRGCRVPLDVWNGVLVDGHNRFEICKENDIDFKTAEIEFNSRIDARLWISENQLKRRNLTPFQKAEQALKMKPDIEAKAKERQREHGNTAPGKTKTVLQNSAEVTKPIDTRQEIAKAAGVSHDTIHRTETILKKATPEVQQQVRVGEISLNRAYTEIKKQDRRNARIELSKELSEKSIDLDSGVGRTRRGDMTFLRLIVGK